ncbi:MAG: RsmB/NOP family class I SAM-dependent RNA methyltransferase [Pedobacter sp.]|nr:MAG: RsmB/NOP family class I SAM-dependent RNA methyltransferase [Pedobacter sp.]
MRVHHQFRSFQQILARYDGKIPLHRFLVAYYKQNKQMGSTDRRWASRYVYAYFRLGKALLNKNLEVRLAVGDFLVNSTPSLIVAEYLPEYQEHQAKPLEEKLKMIKIAFPAFNISAIFPFLNELSKKVDFEEFLTSFLVQPDVFIRVKAVDKIAIQQLLKGAGIDVQDLGDCTLAVPNGTKLEQFLPQTTGYYIQDIASQKTAAYFKPKAYEYWWDCCAASGGKSILLHQLEPSVKLLVSDVRESILENLAPRFKQAGIIGYQKKVLDLRYSVKSDLHAFNFDGILLDAPCTGSGTWGRTPEMLSYFDASKINYFVKLQRDIALNVVPYLKSGQPLIYMTCSVFEAENEGNVAYFNANLPLHLESMELIQKHTQKGDTLFVARFIKK